MVGFISNLAPLLNYLRRRSPGPPFPPEHRQAGERGAITFIVICHPCHTYYFMPPGLGICRTRLSPILYDDKPPNGRAPR
eukprot:scaffold53203_cov37-Phaeocystis_antarctica.AAC.2